MIPTKQTFPTTPLIDDINDFFVDRVRVYHAVLLKILELNYPGTMKDFARLALEDKLELKDGKLVNKP